MKTDKDIPQYIYELNDEEKMLLLRYRVLSDDEREDFINKLLEIKKNSK